MRVYHVTILRKLKKIIQSKNLEPSCEPVSLELLKEEAQSVLGKNFTEEDFFEYFVDYNLEAQRILEEYLNRPDAVYFWLDEYKAYRVATSVDWKDIVVVLICDTKLFPKDCNYYIGNAEISDEMYEIIYYHLCNDIPIGYEDEEKLQQLAEQYHKTMILLNNPEDIEKTYLKLKKEKPYITFELFCACPIPIEAIIGITTKHGKDLTKWFKKHITQPTLKIV